MWQKLKNLYLSATTYSALGPDSGMRRRVNRSLRHRPFLNDLEWFHTFFQAEGTHQAIALFAYTHLHRYSGIPMGRVVPADRLEEDLHWTDVCWFDWEMSLCDDFWQVFHVDISDRLMGSSFSTVEGLIVFLDQQIVMV